MGFLGRDDLLGTVQREYAIVSVEGMGEFRLQSLTESERAQLEDSLLDDEGNQDPIERKALRRRLICLCLVDENGHRILSPDDEESLERVNARVTAALFRECLRLCGFDRDDVKEAAKN